MTTFDHTIFSGFQRSKYVKSGDMNSQWKCVIKMKRWWWWVFLARSPSLDEIFLDLEHTPIRTSLGNWSWKYTKMVYFRPKNGEEKEMKNQDFNAYMCWRMIEMMLECNFTWSMSLIAQEHEEHWRELREFSWCSSLWGFGRGWRGREKDWVCDLCSKVLGRFNDGKYLGNGLQYLGMD